MGCVVGVEPDPDPELPDPDPELPDPPVPELDELFSIGAIVVVVVDVEVVLAASVKACSNSASSLPPDVSAASTTAKVVGGSVGRLGAGATSAVSTGPESRTRTRAAVKTTAPVSANRWKRCMYGRGDCEG